MVSLLADGFAFTVVLTFCAWAYFLGFATVVAGDVDFAALGKQCGYHLAFGAFALA
jgi:hypothetical protein